MKTKKTIIKLLKFLLIFLGITSFIVGLFLVLKSDFLKVNQVVCFENQNACQSDLWFQINGLVLGKNLVLLSPQKVKEEIKGKLTEIDEIKIEKHLPNKLVIHLTKRRPLAIIETDNHYYQVDYQGFVLAEFQQPTDLPLITSSQSAIMVDNHQFKSTGVISSLNCLYQLLMKNIEVRRLEINLFEDLTLFLKKGPQVLISSKKGIGQQVDSLQLILERAKIEGKQIKVIDLRFDKPVVTFI